MASILVTFDVSKELKSSSSKLWQLENILYIYVKLLVLNVLKFILFKFWQQLNIAFIEVTLLVLNVVKSKLVNS